MPTPTPLLANGLAEAAQRFPETARNQVMPPQSIDAMTQFLTITTNLDKEEGEIGPIFKTTSRRSANLIQNLPQDVAMFFEQGMQQMEALNYPQAVRAVMQRYPTAWTRHSLH